MAAINKTIPQVRGDIILFSDANNMYEADVLRQLVPPFSSPNVGAVTGSKSIVRGDGVLGDSEGLYWKYESFIKIQETQLGCCTGVAGEILAIRRELFESPPDNIINDDFYMAMRLVQRGYQIIYVPAARSWERVSLSAEDEVARRARIVAGRYQAITMSARLLPWQNLQVVWQVISHKFLRPLVPFAMIGALLTNVMAIIRPSNASGNRLFSLAFPFNWIFLFLQTAFYGMAWLGHREPDRKGIIGKILYLPTFLVNSNMAAILGLYRFWTKSQTPLWQRVRRRPLAD
jgi:cellulose synthase/poly-beta-1,6-N-acetylglucosamine synthase-like glycosyltransferase